MKKNLFIVFGIIFIGILLGILLYVMIPSHELTYDMLVESGNSNYDIDITYTSEEGISFSGSYQADTNESTLISDDDTSTVIRGNIYKSFVGKMDNKSYKDNSFFFGLIPLQQIVSENEGFDIFIQEPAVYACNYDIFESRVSSITCESSDKNLTIDFYFHEKNS